MQTRKVNTSRPSGFYRNLLAGIFTTGLISQNFSIQPSQAQVLVPCQLPAQLIQYKESLRQKALRGNQEAQKLYKTLIMQQAKQLRACRYQNWPRNQAIWLRLYPCDLRPGSLDFIMDRIANKGYNQVYVEVFYSAQVLLPKADNPTVWESVVKVRGREKADLLAQAIQKGRERGLKVYAWLFTMNFGAAYAQRPDRQAVMARNGRGQTSLDLVNDASIETDIIKGDATKAFIDPYNLQARQDYNRLVEAILKRKPDGMLFDYIRYPRSTGVASVATKVQDLWIYGAASQQVLLQRANNYKGLELIRRFLNQGSINSRDIAQIDQLYRQEKEPLWQGRNPDLSKDILPPAQRQPYWQAELWQLSVAHAAQGVIDFLTAALQPVQRRGLPAGAVFFPSANKAVGDGYDSRVQPWDRFPKTIEWHPMLYANCGTTGCVLLELQRVLSLAPYGTNIRPAIAGVWGKSVGNRPSLEVQMQAIRQIAPQINTVSHFAYSWQEPEIDRERKFCQMR